MSFALDIAAVLLSCSRVRRDCNANTITIHVMKCTFEKLGSLAAQIWILAANASNLKVRRSTRQFDA